MSPAPLDPVAQLEQPRHDRMHPGLVCQQCPIEVASRLGLRPRPNLLERQWPGWVLLAALIVFALAIFCFAY